MVEPNISISDVLEYVQSLRYLLKSNMSVVGSGEGEVIAKIGVRNEAPISPDGGDVVFLGVGLRVIIGREGGNRYGSAYWPSRINKSRPSDSPELRKKYHEGTWIGGQGEAFPEVTSDEQSHGEVLFPGESVVYEIKISQADLPYMDIRVDGAVSRRHLFRISQSLEALEAWTQPLVVETFRALDAIEFVKPLMSIANAIPVLGPQTTLADLDTLKVTIENAINHVQEVGKELNNVYHSAPNQILRDYIKRGIGLYLSSVTKACNLTLEALSGSDMKRMKEAAEGMKALLLKAEEIRRGKA